MTAHENPQPARRNLSEREAPFSPLTKEEVKQAARERISRINDEFIQGFSFITKYPRSATFFGSARFNEENTHYQKARRIANRLSKDGIAVVTGGGPGIMEAANRGACENGGPSLGLNIRLPNEQISNPYVTESVDFYYFFSRKVTLSFSAEAFIFFPGGFGTLDEFFEILTLVQTQKVAKMPIILVGSAYWQSFNAFIEEQLLETYGTIDREDTDLYTITDDEDEVVRIVTEAPLRKEGSPKQ